MSVENKLKEYLENEEFNELEIALKADVGLDISQFISLEPEKRIKIIYDYCQRYNKDFITFYAKIEKAYLDIMKAGQIRSAVGSILAREGPPAQKNLEKYNEIYEKTMEIYENKKD